MSGQQRMMRRFVLSFLAVLLGWLPSTTVLAMGGDHKVDPNGKVELSVHEWPAGVASLINSGGCFSGHWVNANDEFFFRGDAARFNAFLQTYGALTNTPLRLVIHAGSERRSLLWGDKPKEPYDWKLAVLKRGWCPPEWNADVLTNRPAERYVVTIDLWTDKQVAQAEIVVPKNVEVKKTGGDGRAPQAN